jgi:hypothetical protein
MIIVYDKIKSLECEIRDRIFQGVKYSDLVNETIFKRRIQGIPYDYSLKESLWCEEENSNEEDQMPWDAINLDF